MYESCRDETAFQPAGLDWAPSSSESVNNKFLRFGRVCRMSSARKFRSDMSYQKFWQLVSPYQNDQKGGKQQTISMFLFSRNTPYSNRYVSTPLANNGNLRWQLINATYIYKLGTHIRGPTMAEMPSRIMLLLPQKVIG